MHTSQIFSYTAALHSHELTTFAPSLDGVLDVKLASREFPNYTECISSCHRLLDDAAKKLTAATQQKHVLLSEVNPFFSTGKPVPQGSGWDLFEVARIWLQLEEPQASAIVGQARIYASERPEAQVTTN